MSLIVGPGGVFYYKCGVGLANCVPTFHLIVKVRFAKFKPLGWGWLVLQEIGLVANLLQLLKQGGGANKIRSCHNYFGIAVGQELLSDGLFV